MKTSVLEAHDMLSAWSVDEVARRMEAVPAVASVTVDFAAKSHGALRRNPTRCRRYQVGRAPNRPSVNGILFNNAAALEAATKLNVVIFDKTGTLTIGQPEVVEIVMADGVTEDVLLAAAAAVEQGSDHPLAQAILRRAAHLQVVAPTRFESLDGMGERAETATGTVFLGNRMLMDTQQLALGPLEVGATRLQDDGRTAVHVSQAGCVVGLIAIADAIRPTSKTAVAKLCERNIEVVMLAVAYNVVAFPLAAGVLYPFVPSPEVAALSMSGSTLVVAVNALLLRTKLAGINRKPAAKNADSRCAGATCRRRMSGKRSFTLGEVGPVLRSIGPAPDVALAFHSIATSGSGQCVRRVRKTGSCAASH